MRSLSPAQFKLFILLYEFDEKPKPKRTRARICCWGEKEMNSIYLYLKLISS